MGKEALKHTRQIDMSACQIEQYVKPENCRHDFSTFQHLFCRYFRSSGSSLEELSQRTGHSFFYLRQLMDGRRMPTRTDVLCLSLEMKLEPTETEMLLKAAGYESMKDTGFPIDLREYAGTIDFKFKTGWCKNCKQNQNGKR